MNARSGLREFFLSSLLLTLCSSVEGAELSASQERALLDIAGSHPSAATALLFLSKEVPASSSGTLQFEGIPSRRALEVLLDRHGGAARDAGDLVLPRNPYSTAPYFVEVRWAISARSDRARLVSMRAQLVNSEGQPVHPPHLLESPVTIVVANDTFTITRFVSSAFEGT